MRRVLGRIALVLIALLAIAGIYAYQQVTSIESERVTDDVHVLYGLGGNVGVLATDARRRDRRQHDVPHAGSAHPRARREARRRADPGDRQHALPPRSHAREPGLRRGHARSWSTQRTRDYLMHFDADYWKGDAAGTLPNETFDDAHELSVGDKTVRLQHLGRGHTGGDLVVLFVEDRVLHTGDLFFNGRYPNIDLEAGGSVQRVDRRRSTACSRSISTG